MPGVRRFEDFDCWKLSNELKLAIYEVVERPHIKTDRDFCDQIRSAVASAPANIAEGLGGDLTRSSLTFSISRVGH
jgi:four helix bundle protein